MINVVTKAVLVLFSTVYVSPAAPSSTSANDDVRSIIVSAAFSLTMISEISVITVGASLTAVTSIVTIAVSLAIPSVALYSNTSIPLKSGSGS